MSARNTSPVLQAAAIYLAVQQFSTDHGLPSQEDFPKILEALMREWVTTMNLPDDDLRAEIAVRMLKQLSQACSDVTRKIEAEHVDPNRARFGGASSW